MTRMSKEERKELEDYILNHRSGYDRYITDTSIAAGRVQKEFQQGCGCAILCITSLAIIILSTISFLFLF